MGYNDHVGVAIGLDLFPAQVTLPDGTQMYPARVWIADGELLVYIVANGVPVEYYRSAYISLEGTRIAGLSIDTADGMVTARKKQGCGCGNPLKSFNPWPNERRELVRL